MDLTPNFSSREFVVSERYPDLVEEIWKSLIGMDHYKFFLLARTILQPIRDYLGLPVKITSGKRSDVLNKAVGGAATSDHLYKHECAAVDFTLNDPFKTQKAHIFLLSKRYLFGQLIMYPDEHGFHTFIHVSLPSKSHLGECLRKVNGKFEKL